MVISAEIISGICVIQDEFLHKLAQLLTQFYNSGVNISDVHMVFIYGSFLVNVHLLGKTGYSQVLLGFFTFICLGMLYVS